MQEDLISLLFSIVLIVLLALLALLLLHRAAKRVTIWAKSLSRIHEARKQQVITLIQTARWILDILLVGLALMMVLSTLGVDITPLLASAGVAGLAVSLGAQSLIKDLIGGLLILLENQFAVGDNVEIGNVVGVVERITLRTTQVRGVAGQLYTIPNGDVRTVSNQTRDWSRAIVDIGVAYEENLERVLAVLVESVEGFGQDPAFQPILLEPPQVLGPMGLAGSTVTLRVMVKTLPGEQWMIARELRKFVLAVCEQEGISLPYPRQELWVRGFEEERAAADPS